MAICERCEGRTWVEGTNKLGEPDPTAPTEPCPVCDSTGEVSEPMPPPVEPEAAPEPEAEPEEEEEEADDEEEPEDDEDDD